MNQDFVFKRLKTPNRNERYFVNSNFSKNNSFQKSQPQKDILTNLDEGFKSKNEPIEQSSLANNAKLNPDKENFKDNNSKWFETKNTQQLTYSKETHEIIQTIEVKRIRKIEQTNYINYFNESSTNQYISTRLKENLKTLANKYSMFEN